MLYRNVCLYLYEKLNSTHTKLHPPPSPKLFSPTPYHTHTLASKNKEYTSARVNSAHLSRCRGYFLHILARGRGGSVRGSIIARSLFIGLYMHHTLRSLPPSLLRARAARAALSLSLSLFSALAARAAEWTFIALVLLTSPRCTTVASM